MSNLLCMWHSPAFVLIHFLCARIHLCHRVRVYFPSYSKRSFVCVIQSWHITRTLLYHNPFSVIRLHLFCEPLRSQSCCHTSESPPADTSGCAQRINSVCLMFNYTLINTYRSSTTREWMEMSVDIELMLSTVEPVNESMEVLCLAVSFDSICWERERDSAGRRAVTRQNWLTQARFPSKCMFESTTCNSWC